MEKINLVIDSHRGSYQVSFEKDLDFLGDLKKRNAIWVIDQNVFNLYSGYFRGINSDLLILFGATESAKTLDGAMRLHSDLIAKSCKRNTNFISVGGGITQDVTGFVASTLYRGLNWIYVPTTLLAQADSCIGSKTSLNFDSYKNLLGTFYPPKEIFISAEFLKSLSKIDMASGLGEIIKFQLMKAKRLSHITEIVSRLEKIERQGYCGDALLDIVYDSLVIKREYIEEDEFDDERRRFLNYGHCFGHALESVSHFEIPHGLAVVGGMIFANIIALKREWISNNVFDSVVRNLLTRNFHGNSLGLRDNFFEPHNLFDAMGKDKKRIGQGVAIILPKFDFQLHLVQDLSFEEMVGGVEEFKKIIA